MMETASETGTLAGQLAERIHREGPITFHDWMKAALYDSTFGYYCRPDLQKWGREGDYRTSPEGSFLFAATFARYFAQLHEEMGKPREWNIVEAGAGNGDFACGLMQTLQNHFPEVFSATRYVIDEASVHSTLLARKRLEPFASRVAFRKLDDTKLDPGVIFSNELLDAFPVHRVKNEGGKLWELYVDSRQDGKFDWQMGPLSTQRLNSYFSNAGTQLAEGQIADVNLAIEGWLRQVAASLRKGFHIAVDYGAMAEELFDGAQRHDGTLRGFRRHRHVEDILDCPGEQDLTTTVDWSFVSRIGEEFGLHQHDFERQDKFLMAAGLLDQLEQELKVCGNEAERLRLTTAAREMILPDGMASSFQVMVQKRHNNPTNRQGVTV